MPVEQWRSWTQNLECCLKIDQDQKLWALLVSVTHTYVDGAYIPFQYDHSCFSFDVWEQQHLD